MAARQPQPHRTVTHCNVNPDRTVTRTVNPNPRLGHVKKLQEALDCNVFMCSYRGYGMSTGTPDEEGLREDAQAHSRHFNAILTRIIAVLTRMHANSRHFNADSRHLRLLAPCSRRLTPFQR